MWPPLIVDMDVRRKIRSSKPTSPPPWLLFCDVGCYFSLPTQPWKMSTSSFKHQNLHQKSPWKMSSSSIRYHHQNPRCHHQINVKIYLYICQHQPLYVNINININLEICQHHPLNIILNLNIKIFLERCQRQNQTWNMSTSISTSKLNPKYVNINL